MGYLPLRCLFVGSHFGLSHGDPTGYAPQATAIAKDTNERLGGEFDHALETR